MLKRGAPFLNGSQSVPALAQFRLPTTTPEMSRSPKLLQRRTSEKTTGEPGRPTQSRSCAVTGTKLLQRLRAYHALIQLTASAIEEAFGPWSIAGKGDSGTFYETLD